MDDIAIIGAGASGLAAALSVCEAARRERDPQPALTLYERSDKVGRSILRSGNGRCNFSNASLNVDRFHNAAFVADALASPVLADAAGNDDACNPVVSFFARHGLVSREEAEGRLYPLSNKASTIVDIFRLYLSAYNVPVELDAALERIEPPREEGGHFTLRHRSGRISRAKRLIVCTGASDDGFGLEDMLPFTTPTPLLGPLRTDTTFAKPLDNIRLRGTVTLKRNGDTLVKESGEVMFRKYGVSGIAVFNLSRFAKRGDTISIDCLPRYDHDQLTHLFMVRRDDFETLTDRPCTNQIALVGMVLPLVADQILRRAGLAGEDILTDEGIARMVPLLKSFDLIVSGMGPSDQCQVNRGGFAVSALNPQTLETRAIRGLYLAGEALDVDGPCGGYNLTWAFASGLIAGASAAASLWGA